MTVGNCTTKYRLYTFMKDYNICLSTKQKKKIKIQKNIIIVNFNIYVRLLLLFLTVDLKQLLQQQ